MGRRSQSEADLAVATVVEVAASHSVFVSQPAAVADLIKRPPPRSLRRTYCGTPLLRHR